MKNGAAAAPNTGGGGGGAGSGGTGYKGGAGGSGVVIIRISLALPGPIYPPVIKDDHVPAVVDGGTYIYGVTNVSLYSAQPDIYTIAGPYSAANVNEYSFVVTLKDGFAWFDGTTGSQTVNWRIVRAPNAITELTLPGWEVKGDKSTSKPNYITMRATWGADTVQYAVTEGYDPGNPMKAVWRPLSSDVATRTEELKQLDPGEHWLRATVPQAQNWDGAEKIISFKLWKGLSDTFTDSVTLKITGYQGTETLTNFPMLVRISETRAIGFLYDRATRNGLPELGFSDTDGNILKFDVELWNPAGESLVWVQVQKLRPYDPATGAATEIQMYWHRQEGIEDELVPEPQAELVWADYDGVWHFNEEYYETVQTNDVSRDATGHGNDAYPADVKLGVEMAANSPLTTEEKGAIGRARTIANTSLSTYDSNAHLFVPTSTNEVGLVARTNFTFSGWAYLSRNTYNQNAPYNVLVARKDLFRDGDGWLVHIAAAASKTDAPRILTAYGATNRTATLNLTPTAETSVLGEWVYFAATYASNQVALCGARLDGEFTKTPGMSSVLWPLTTTNTTLVFGNMSTPVMKQSFFGALDEFRLSSVMRSTDWLKAEFDTVKRADFYTFGLVNKDGLKVNYFKTLPSLPSTNPPNTWEKQDKTQAEDFGRLNPGELREDDTSVSRIRWRYYSYTENKYYDDFANDADFGQLPPGKYRIEFDFDDPNEEYDHGFLPDPVVFIILYHDRYQNAGGGLGETGRVLLANRDDTEGARVDYQSSDCTNPDMPTFWEVVTNTVETSYRNLLPGTEWVLWTRHYGTRLWHLVDCRLGNIYPKPDEESLALYTDNCFLPFSTTSFASTNREAVATRKSAGQVTMRNTNKACIYSPYYTNGIGTIYFDVVNGAANRVMSDDFQLKISVATNCLTNAAWLPTDEHIHEVEWVDEEIAPDVIVQVPVTNYYRNANWQPVPLIVTRLVNQGVTGPTNHIKNALFSPNNTTMARADCFYRVTVPLVIHGPARFKIERMTYNSDVGVDFADERSQILFDNIIVSAPPMRADFTAYGLFDGTKTGKHILGQENAWNVPFPSFDDVIVPRAKANYYTNEGDTNANVTTFVPWVQMRYRWRYLSQRFDPTNSRDDGTNWRSADLIPRGGGFFEALEPLTKPDAVGDLEYYFVSELSAPYYQYVDYSGLNIGVLDGTSTSSKRVAYTEEVRKVTARRPRGSVAYPTQGTDWFVRLREGKSDYEELFLLTRPVGGGAATETKFELLGNHQWTAYLQTLTQVAEGLEFRIEARNLQTPTSLDFAHNTNRWYSASAVDELPRSVTLEINATTNDWTQVVCDAATGYLMFQVDDSSHSLTVTHADKQDFNAWSDAFKKKTDGTPLFVGSSDQDGLKVGTSPKKREFDEPFANWTDSVATNGLWELPFDVTTASYEYGPYEKFASTEVNGWYIGPAQFVYEKCRNDKSGLALQMVGCGRGYLQFVDAEHSPRGIEKIDFTARLGQSIAFNNFSYYDGDVKARMTNYAFSVRAAFDLNKSKNFSGNASLSVIAFYQPTVGCYEYRLEVIDNNVDAKSGELGGNRLIRGTLYRWRPGGGNKGMVPTQLGVTHDITGFPLTDGENGYYMPVYISVANELAKGRTTVMAGLCKEANFLTPTMNYNAISNHTFQSLLYYDTDVSARLTKGTFGVLSANCDGVFLKPMRHPQAVIIVDKNGKPVTPPVSSGKQDNKFIAFIAPTSEDVDALERSVREIGVWAYEFGRMEPYYDESSRQLPWGLKCQAPSQTLRVYVGEKGKASGWKEIKSVTLSSFGKSNTSGDPQSFELYRTDDCSLKIAVDGDEYDTQVDVVVDNIKMTQWRGDTYGSVDTRGFLPATDDSSYGWRTNFYFTSGWIHDRKVELNAKRTDPNKPCSIRSPLMDGYSDRGIGLGMFSFEYENATTGANLLLQVATNQTTDISGISDELNPGTWLTVTNFSFRGADSTTLKGGTRSCYLGMHGVRGVMRLIMDPAVVNAMQSVSDPQQFAKIDITHVFCRDEPSIDTTCWWGWNLRTFGADPQKNVDVENMMFLPDLATDASAGGLTLALNNSTERDVQKTDPETYKQHMPFVQTPTFASNIVGEVRFRARRYLDSDAKYNKQPAEVALYGALSGDEALDANWKLLARFIISNEVFSTYNYKTLPGDNYAAFRLGVTGVKGVTEQESRGPEPQCGAEPVRVLVDEVVVCEAVRPSMGFVYVYPFRNSDKGQELSLTTAVPDMYSCDHQPLLKEAWSVQAQIEVKMLPDEIDLENHKPRVLFHWFRGRTPWGYKNWRKNKAAQVEELRAADDDPLVFRGGYVPVRHGVVPVPADVGTLDVYQYSAEVIYRNKSGQELTNVLSATEWKRPDWYAPLDYNKGPLAKEFSAYNIMEGVAPRRVWINELNCFDSRDAAYNNTAKTNQYVELAVPAYQDIKDWSLEYIDYDLKTNHLCTFGYEGLPATKQINISNEYAFLTVQSPTTAKAHSLDPAKGEVDGTWKDFDQRGGELTEERPVALRLLRPSGIVEQEILFQGTNIYAGSIIGYKYEPSYQLDKLNSAATKGCEYYYVGNEHGTGIRRSLSVTNEVGRATNDWTNLALKTPGRANDGQAVPPVGYVIYPNGDMIVITSELAGGHLWQDFGEVTNSTAGAMAMVRKGGDGTNLTYHVARWYEVAAVRTAEGKDLSSGLVAKGLDADGRSVYELLVGKGVSNNISLVTTAQPRRDLREEYGLTPDNDYTDAVLAWLEGGTTMKAEFENPGEIHLPIFKSVSEQIVTNLTLTQAYWLDIDPTGSNWCFKAGMIQPPYPCVIRFREDGSGYPRYDPTGDLQKTNVTLGVFMLITNETTNVNHPHYRWAWSPYVLRGRAPGETSADYTERGQQDWNSVTFKITGDLQNGKPFRTRWLPLRYFTFNANSFDARHRSVIDIRNQFEPGTEGHSAGWADYPDCSIFYSWSIDTRFKPTTAEVLCPTNSLTTW